MKRLQTLKKTFRRPDADATSGAAGRKEKLRNRRETPTPAIVWHYTTLGYFRSILRDGFIKPATEYVPPGERPVVWFSSNPVWENSAAKGVTERRKMRTLTFEEHVGVGLVRIGVQSATAPYQWQEIKELSHMDASVAQNLYNVAIAEGARPGEWYGTFDPVPRDAWISVETWREGEWHQFDASLLEVDQAGDATPPEVVQRMRDLVQMFADADVIFGRDEAGPFLVFGTEKLMQIVGTGQGMQLKHVTVPIDEETELEMLLAAVQVAKGHHEYQSSESGVG